MQAPTAIGLSRSRACAATLEAMSELPLQLQPDGPRPSDKQPGPVCELRSFGNQVANDTQLVEHVACGESELPGTLIHTGSQVQQSVRAQRTPAVYRRHIVEAGARTGEFILRAEERRTLSHRHHVLCGR